MFTTFLVLGSIAGYFLVGHLFCRLLAKAWWQMARNRKETYNSVSNESYVRSWALWMHLFWPILGLGQVASGWASTGNRHDTYLIRADPKYNERRAKEQDRRIAALEKENSALEQKLNP